MNVHQPEKNGRGPRFSSQRSRIALVLVVALLLGVGFLTFQSWRIVDAIVTVEQSAVVPLPTRNASTAVDSVSDASSTPPAVRIESPWSSPGIAVGDAVQPPKAAAPAVQIDAPAVSGTALPAAADTSEKPPADPDPLSRLDVVRAMVDAAIDGGDPGASSVWAGRQSLNILVVGVDRRPEGGDQNADVIIVARVDLVHKSVSAVSIPRDLLVDVPGFGQDKINSAYNHGVQSSPDDPAAGIALVRDTVEGLTGVAIDDYVLIDFAGFEDIVDSLGGITVDVPYPIHDDAYPADDFGVEVVDFPAGPQQFDGETALKYVRTRHADSDDARRERQLQVLRVIFAEASTIGSVNDVDNLILAGGDSIQTSFPLDQQLTLARLARQLDDADINLTTLSEPLIVPGWTDDGRWVYVADPEAVRLFIAEAVEGTSGATAPVN